MKIGEVSQRTGCPIARIRFYEKKGLVPNPDRTTGNQRNYTQAAVDRLNFIANCRANGMKLECIARLIEFEQDPSKGNAWLLERIDEYIEQARLHRERLEKAEKYLQQLRANFPAEVLAQRDQQD